MISSLNSTVQFTCHPCNIARRCLLSDAINIQCRACGPLLKLCVPTDDSMLIRALKDITNLYPDEEWRAVKGGWISSYGKGVSCFGKVLTPDDHGRYYLAGHHDYVCRIMWRGFPDKVSTSDHARLQLTKDPESKVDVSVVDTSQPLHVSKLLVRLRFESASINKTKVRSQQRLAADSMTIDDKVDIERRTIPELPHHIIFADGSIYNSQQCIGGNRFISGNLTMDGYLKFETNSATASSTSYYIHKLVCMAYHPIEGKTTYSEYKDLQCNHINGQPDDNRAENLEWVDQSSNQLHAYATGLNKKVRGVKQFQRNSDGLWVQIGEFISIAEASRQTKVAEDIIRRVAQGKTTSSSYVWKFINEDQSEEYSKKFTSKRKLGDESKVHVNVSVPVFRVAQPVAPAANPCQDLINNLLNRGCTFVSDTNNILTSKSVVQIMCSPCNIARSGPLVDLIEKQCRNCGLISKTLVPTSTKVLDKVVSTLTDLHPDEEWKAVEGGWLSNYGKAVSCFGTVMKVDANGRVKLGNKMQPVVTWIRQVFGHLNGEQPPVKKTNVSMEVDTEAKVQTPIKISAIPYGKRKLLGQYQVVDKQQGDLIHVYQTIAEAANATGIPRHVITDAAKGVTKKIGQYIWKFLDHADLAGKPNAPSNDEECFEKDQLDDQQMVDATRL